ncbi:InlB B-repeat-containing protein, partial [Candidatus Saccharibacteria bacterium]|nr:InlB B-repeat-containing protein [Candidatus Saccharibacteria bacterium]
DDTTDARAVNFDLTYIDNTSIFTDSTWDINHATQYTGDYYNWYAANAETSTGLPGTNSQDSICPLGWQLPNNDDAGDPNLVKSYTQLLKNNTTGYGIFATEGDNIGPQVINAIYKTPLSLYAFGSPNAETNQLTPPSVVNNIVEITSAYTRQGDITKSNRFYAARVASSDTVWSYGMANKTAKYTVRCVSRGTTLPSDYEAEIATTCSAGKICYDGNGATSGEMTDQSAESNTSTMLTAPLHKKTGYAFAGWSTEENGFGEIYGPNQILTTPDLSSKGMQLYAKWVPSVGEFQTWTGCSAMDEGQVIGLTDNRDGKTYSVAKLKDSNCWMTQNLNLDLASFAGTNNLTSSNTDLNSKSTWDPSASTETKINSTYASELSARGLSSDFTGLSTLLLGQTQPSQFQTSNQTGYWWSSKVSDDGSYTALDQVTNNSNSEIPRTYATARGELYNWYAATAESGTYAFDVPDEAEDSVCPSGWRLPTDAANGSVIPKSWRGLMNDTLGINAAATSATDEDFTALSSYPLSLMFDGNYHHLTGDYIPTRSGNYWTSLKTSAISARNLNYNTIESIIRPGDGSNKTYGLSVRCVQR